MHDFLGSSDCTRVVQSVVEEQGKGDELTVAQEQVEQVIAEIHTQGLQREFPNCPSLPPACVSAAVQDLGQEFPLDVDAVKELYSLSVKKFFRL